MEDTEENVASTFLSQRMKIIKIMKLARYFKFEVFQHIKLFIPMVEAINIWKVCFQNAIHVYTIPNI